MLEVPEFIKPEQIWHVVSFVRKTTKCPYCLQPFRNHPEIPQLADHIVKCVRKLELNKNLNRGH